MKLGLGHLEPLLCCHFLPSDICSDRLSPCWWRGQHSGLCVSVLLDGWSTLTVWCFFKDDWQWSLCPCNPSMHSVEMVSFLMPSLGWRSTLSTLRYWRVLFLFHCSITLNKCFFLLIYFTAEPMVRSSWT